MNNNCTKRKVGADDELPNKRAPEGIEKTQRSSTFQKPGPASSKKGSIDQKTALVHQPAPASQRSPNLSKDGPEDRRSEFIWLVRKFPHLYNPKDPAYRNSAKKQKSWTIVSEVLGMTANDCRVYWKVLRDRYYREKKKLPEHVAEDFRLLMETDLKFLEPTIQHRKPFGNTFVSDASMEIAQSLEPRFLANPADPRLTTSPQSHPEAPDIKTPSPGDQPREPLPKILISIHKPNSVRQSRASFSVSPVRSTVSVSSRHSSSTAAATVQQTAFGPSPVPNAERESTFNDDEECDNSSGYAGSSVEEDQDDDDDVVSGVGHSSEKNLNASLDDAFSTLPRNDDSAQNLDQQFFLQFFDSFLREIKSLSSASFYDAL